MKKDDTQVLQALLRTNFSAFLQKVFAHLHPNQELKLDPYLLALTYELELCRRGTTRRLAVSIAPRMLKTVTASIALPAFILGHDPGAEILGISYGEDPARDNGRMFRRVIESDWYNALFPHTKFSTITDLDAVTTLNGRRLGLSMNGAITGRGADYIIIDDPMKAEDGNNQNARDTVARLYSETIQTRLNDPNKGVIIAISQRLHVNDLIGRLECGGQFKYVNFPIVAYDKLKYKIGDHEHDTFTFHPGKLLSPDRIGVDAIKERRNSMTSAAFSAQYLGKPVPDEGTMILRSWFRRYTERPAQEWFDLTALSIDTATKTGSEHDFSVCITAGIKGGDVYILDRYRERIGFFGLQKTILKIIESERPDIVIIEDATLGYPLAQFIHTNTSVPVKLMSTKGSKKDRVGRSTAVMQGRRFYLPEKSNWLGLLEEELASFPNGDHDDQVDAVAQLINWHMDQELRKTQHLKVKITTFGEGGYNVFES